MIPFYAAEYTMPAVYDLPEYTYTLYVRAFDPEVRHSQSIFLASIHCLQRLGSQAYTQCLLDASGRPQSETAMVT